MGYTLPVTNGGAETGDLTGWTVVSPGFETTTGSGYGGVDGPHTGTYFFAATTVNFAEITQDLPVPPEAEAEVDAGTFLTFVSWWQASNSSTDDEGRIGFRFLDGSGVQIGEEFPPYNIPGPAWAYRYLLVPLPAGTRTVQLVVQANKVSGTNNNAYFDDISNVGFVNEVETDFDFQWSILDGNYTFTALDLQYAIQGPVEAGWNFRYAVGVTARPILNGAAIGRFAIKAVRPSAPKVASTPSTGDNTTSDGSMHIIDWADLPPGKVSNSLYAVGDILYRIWVIPDIMRVQNPRIGVGIPFDVWNAYPWPNTLTAVHGGLAGLELDFDPPVSLNEVELRRFHITITPAAPIQIDTTFIFDFEYGDGTLNFQASIADFVQMVPDPPVTEYWDWLTDVMTTWDGSEQRISLRATPRRSTNYSFPLETDIERQRQWNRWYKSLATRLVLPYYQYATVLTQRSAIGADKLFFDPAKTDVRAGEFGILLDTANEQGYLVQFASLEADGAVLEAPITFDAQAGWVIAPAFTSRLADGSGLRMRTISGKITIDAEQLDIREEFKRPGSTAPIDVFDGLNVLNRRPLADEDVPETFNVNYEVMDGGVGVMEIKSSWLHPVVSGARKFLIHRYSEPQEMDYWRDFLDAARGQQNPFLFSTWRDDLMLAVKPELGTNQLVVTNTDYPSMYFPYESFRRVQIELMNGTLLWRRVQTATDNGDGTVTLELSGTFGTNPGDNDIRKISFLEQVRLGSDRVKLVHYHLDTIIELQIQTVDE